MSDSPDVLLDRHDGVATITLDRPDSLNSLTDTAKTLLLSAVREVADDDATRAVVLTGAGRGFCVGQDLRQHTEQLLAGSRGPFESIERYYNPIALCLAQMPKPVIAAINGVAAGAGLSLAMLADFRVAARGAVFTTAFAGIGLSCDTGASWTLQRLVGPSQARQLLFDPSTIDAERALDIGLVDRLVDDGEALDAAQEWAARLASGPTLAYAALRDALAYASTHSLAESLAHEEPLMIRTGTSDDHRRAVEAFLAKEKPTFEGR